MRSTLLHIAGFAFCALLLTPVLKADESSTASENFVVLGGTPGGEGWSTHFDGLEARAIVRFDSVTSGRLGQPIVKQRGPYLGSLSLSCKENRFSIVLLASPPALSGMSGTALANVMGLPSVVAGVDTRGMVITEAGMDRLQFLNIVSEMHDSLTFNATLESSPRIKLLALLTDGPMPTNAEFKRTADAMGWLHSHCRN